MSNSDLGAAGRRAGLIRAVWPMMRGLDTKPRPRHNARSISENDEFSRLIVF